MNRACDPSPASNSDEAIKRNSVSERMKQMQFRLENVVYPMLRRIHAKQANDIRKLVLFVSGAGSMAVPWLFSQAGSSRHVLDARVPYDTQASRKLTLPMHSLAFKDIHFERVGHRVASEKVNTVLIHEMFPENSSTMVSFHQARYLAVAAYREALTLQAASSIKKQLETKCYGVGCTAAISSWKDRRGMNHAYISSWNGSTGHIQYIRMRKNLEERIGEEMLVSDYLMKNIAQAQGETYEEIDTTDVMEEMAEWSVRAYTQQERLHRFISSHSKHELSDYLFVSGGQYYGPQDLVLDKGVRILLYSGSFNPLHKGHENLARIALDVADAQLNQDQQERCPYELVFEIALKNADKDPLSEHEEVLRRINQLADYHLCLTKAPLFIQKARLFPGCSFVVGWDTIVRILDVKYYDGSRAKLIEAMVEFRQLNVQFIIAGRLDSKSSKFMTLDDVEIPEGFEKMFVGIPEDWFREDISSTEIRKRLRMEKEHQREEIVSSGAGSEEFVSSRSRNEATL